MAWVVYEDAVAPEALVMNITPGSSGVDLSTVTAGSFKVLKSDGSEATYTGTRSNQTTTTLTLTYTILAADLAKPGRYAVYASLTIPSGTVRTKPQVLYVRGKYETEVG